MTELNLLYGGDNLLNDNNTMDKKENAYSSKISSQQLHQIALNNDGHGNDDKQMLPPPQSQSMQIAQQQIAMQMAQQQQQQMAQQQVQQQMMQQQPSQNTTHQQQQMYKNKNDYNFLDRMNMKKSEVIKLALFSLVIVLGISIDRMLTYYVSKYINDNVLTDFQELLLRLSYPITIFLLLWIFKAI
jgi:cation transport ATPase